MKAVAGALVLLAGAVLVGAGVVAEAVHGNNPHPGQPLPAAVVVCEVVGTVLGVVGAGLTATGVFEAGREGGPPRAG